MVTCAFVCSWPVGKFTCSVALPIEKGEGTQQINIEWEPSLPDLNKLPDAAKQQYINGRNEAFQKWATVFGQHGVVVVEL